MEFPQISQEHIIDQSTLHGWAQNEATTNYRITRQSTNPLAALNAPLNLLIVCCLWVNKGTGTDQHAANRMLCKAVDPSLDQLPVGEKGICAMIKIKSYVVITFCYRKANILQRWSNILHFFYGNKGCVTAADLIDSDENLHCFTRPLSSCNIKISVVSQCRCTAGILLLFNISTHSLSRFF